MRVSIDSDTAISKTCRQLLTAQAYKDLQLFLDKALAAEPLNADIWFWIAITSFKQSNLSSAYRAIEQACQLNPASVEGLAFMGQVLGKQGLALLAEQVWRQVVYLDPLNKRYRQYWLKLLQQLNKSDAYIQQTLAAIANNSESPLESTDLQVDFQCSENFSIEMENICVIIPVYDDYNSVHQCLESIIETRAHCNNVYSILVINDASPDKRIGEYLQSLKQQGLIRLLENANNLGFIRTVNKALTHCIYSDVVLLNADTVVYHDWLDRLYAIACRDKQVASITPFSNNAQLVSFPRSNVENRLASAAAGALFDTACAQANAEHYMEIPTGIGFCLYLRRMALNQVGYLDEVELLRGYGEEVDLCQRLRLAGWKNVCATGVFVAHQGGTSFKQEKRFRVMQNQQVLNRRYPEYLDEYRLFLQRDPLQAARCKVEEVLLAANKHSHTLIVAPENAWHHPAMESVRFQQAANSTPTLWLYHVDKGAYAGRKWLHLAEDKPTGLSNLRYRWPEEQARLQQHLQQLHITEVQVYAPELLQVPLSQMLQAYPLRNRQQPVPAVLPLAAQPLPTKQGIATAQADQEPLVIALSGNFNERASYEFLWALITQVQYQQLPLRFWLLQASLDDQALLRTGKASFALNFLFTTENLASRLAAAGVACVGLFPDSPLYQHNQQQLLATTMPLVDVADADIPALVTTLWETASNTLEERRRHYA